MTSVISGYQGQSKDAKFTIKHDINLSCKSKVSRGLRKP